jgi:UDP-4-amino-4,6-dideoxy-N-acetyl-beta-L-altrosamine transaminase
VSGDDSFLPYGRQWIFDEDRAAVDRALRSDWLTQGPEVEGFEAALAAKVGAKHAVACANGTAALYLAYLALDLTPLDAVIAPSITFLATASAAKSAGATVVFADVDPETGLMTAATADEALTRAVRGGLRPRVVAPVHMAGQTVDMPGVAAVAAKVGAFVIEDACHALGTVDCRDENDAGATEPVGACRRSAMTVFSFHPVKTVAAGEGGAVTVNDPALARRLRMLRNHGMTRDPNDFTVTELAFASDGSERKVNPWHYEQLLLGLNCRLSDLHAALASSQLKRLDFFVERRRVVREAYVAGLRRFGATARMTPAAPWCRPAWHLATALVDFPACGRTRADVMSGLRDRGIGTQVHYIPVHRQPYWRDASPTPELPGADGYFRAALSLPLFAAMTVADVERVVDALSEVLSAA